MRREIPIACNLSAQDQNQRRRELVRLFEHARQSRGLRDGYEFTFPGSAELTAKLAGFVASERECCPFFAFELLFEPGKGPILLRIKGPEGAKDLIKDEILFGLDGERIR